MKAKVRDIDFSPDQLAVGVDFYFEEGEQGYAQYDKDGVQRPFRSVSLTFPPDVEVAEVRNAIIDKLAGFKRAHTKIAAARQWVGWECNT